MEPGAFTDLYRNKYNRYMLQLALCGGGGCECIMWWWLYVVVVAVHGGDGHQSICGSGGITL